MNSTTEICKNKVGKFKINSEKEFIKELAKLQKTYFEGGLMPRQEYDKKIVKLETELKILRKKTGEKK